MKIKLLGVTILSLLILNSCQKEKISQDVESNNSAIKSQTITQTLKFEHVDRELIQKYINYQQEREINSMLLKSGVSKTNIVSNKISPEEARKMIDNYLANERNVLRLNAASSSSRDPWWWETPVEIEGDGGPTFPPVTGNINGTGNTVTIVITMNGTTITSLNYSVGGFHGTIAAVGGFTQSVYNGVTTYGITLGGSWAVSGNVGASGGGVNGGAGGSGFYTTNVYIYGNVYNGQFTVGGLVLTPYP